MLMNQVTDKRTYPHIYNNAFEITCVIHMHTCLLALSLFPILPLLIFQGMEEKEKRREEKREGEQRETTLPECSY